MDITVLIDQMTDVLAPEIFNRAFNIIFPYHRYDVTFVKIVSKLHIWSAIELIWQFHSSLLEQSELRNHKFFEVNNEIYTHVKTIRLQQYIAQTDILATLFKNFQVCQKCSEIFGRSFLKAICLHGISLIHGPFICL